MFCMCCGMIDMLLDTCLGERRCGGRVVDQNQQKRLMEIRANHIQNLSFLMFLSHCRVKTSM